jgi:hypothetical protein
LKNEKVELAARRNGFESVMRDDLAFNLNIDNSESWWNQDVSDKTRDQFNQAIIQFCVKNGLSAHDLKESNRQIREILPTMA